MPFYTFLQCYLSVADSLEHLYQCFIIEEILKLQKEGFSVLEYESSDYWFYEPYKHNVISSDNLKLTNIITFNERH